MIKRHREKRCLSESTKWHPTQVSEFNIQKILPVKHWCSSTCGMTTLRLWDFHRTSWSTCWYTLSIKAIQHQKPYSKTHSPGESNTPKSQVGWEMPATDCMIILLNNWIVLTMKTSKWIKLYIFKLPLRFTIHHHHNSASRKFSCCSGVFNKMASAICSRSRLERRKYKKSTGWQGVEETQQFNQQCSNLALCDAILSKPSSSYLLLCSPGTEAERPRQQYLDTQRCGHVASATCPLMIS